MEKNLHDNEVMDRLKGFSIPWDKDQEEVWQTMEEEMENKGEVVALKVGSKNGRREAIVETIENGKENGKTVGRMIRMNRLRSVAAVLMILITTGLVMRFFERHIESAYGEHLTHQLPDGSVIEMNSGSSLVYHPFWWRFDRSLTFEGEGFFMVQKGKAFVVESARAVTQVLGTSFSVFSREDDYKVICHTGRVQVTAVSSEGSTVLTPNQVAILMPDGQLELSTNIELPDPTPWKSRIFEFTATPLSEVFDEIQRQYDVVIKYPGSIDYFYTGSLKTDRDIASTLSLVCKAFKITFGQNTGGEYQIFENNHK